MSRPRRQHTQLHTGNNFWSLVTRLNSTLFTFFRQGIPSLYLKKVLFSVWANFGEITEMWCGNKEGGPIHIKHLYLGSETCRSLSCRFQSFITPTLMYKSSIYLSFYRFITNYITSLPQPSVWEASISSNFNSSSFITPTPSTSSTPNLRFIRYNKQNKENPRSEVRHGGLEHLKIETRLIDERFESVMGECVT